MTAISSYLSDTLSFIDPLLLGIPLPGKSAASLRGLSENVVEQRWKRARAKKSGDSARIEQAKVGSLLRLPPESWDRSPRPAPPPYCPIRMRFGWRAVQEMLGFAAREESWDGVAQRCFVSALTAERVQRAAFELEIRTGISLGGGSARLHLPKSSPLFLRLHALVDAEDNRLENVAREWVSLAKPWPLENGLQMLRADSIGALQSLAAELDFRAVKHEPNPENSRQTPTRVQVLGPEGGSNYGVWPCLRWALAVAWVASAA